jgi:hypothetical protein
MTAFVVFGTSYAKCLEKARKTVSTDKVDSEEWEVNCHKEAAELYQTAGPVRISKRFGAPQFCKDFMGLCNADKFKNLSVRAYQKTGKAITKGKKEGMDAYAWLPYPPVD